MAMKCNNCGGIIPDVVYGECYHTDLNNCKNHIKPEINVRRYTNGQIR